MKRKREDIDLGGMQLRSGRKLSVKESITIPVPVKLELEKTIDTLKSLLKDDQVFLEKIVKKSLLLGHGVYSDELQRLVCTKYPIPYGHDRLLSDTVSDLMALIGCRHPLIKDELQKIPIKGYTKPNGELSDKEDIVKLTRYESALRTEIEKEIVNLFLEPSIDGSSVTLIGESEQSLDIDI